ncbi:MAG: YbaN family protein [Methanosarcinaceae archaeon]|nr:YbaN family protein [Methanosarcinaceae archaeon]
MKDDEVQNDCFGMTSFMSKRLIRGILVIAGSVFTGLGLLGIFLPLLPTTPFLLLAVACYARSSKRCHFWLLDNKWFGSFIKDYYEKKGIKLRVKIISISLLWISISYSVLFVIGNLFVSSIMAIIALGVTIFLIDLNTL